MKHCAGVKFPTLTTASAEDKWPHLCLGGSGTSAAISSISWPVHGTLGRDTRGCGPTGDLASRLLHDDDGIHTTTTSWLAS